MRLLTVNESDPAKTEIKEFTNIPPYAILSHRWGEEEVTFQDVQEGHPETKKGYQKLQKCLELARKRGHKYVWMDTCCIDKTSSVELSEAINSMYQWYQEAEECYAYLADVSDSQISESEWFYRGWTLQELIASSTLIFFNQRWEELGTKEALSHVVSRRTSIPVGILKRDDDLETVSIAQRMSWAAERKTTKPEDLAYCLMGIFGINMPPLYGEGQRSFIRLQEEIMKVSDDHSIFAWKSLDQNHGGLLATSPEAFKESTDIILKHNHLVTANKPWTVNNKGISLELPFIGIGHQGLGAAILPCSKSLVTDSFLAVYLRDQSFTMEQFERVWCEKLEAIDLTGFQPSQCSARLICVRQQRLAVSRTKGHQKLGRDRKSSKEFRCAPESARGSPKLELFDGQMKFVDITEPTIQPTSQESVAITKVQPADTDVRDDNGRTPLSYAAGEGRVEEVRSLLARMNIHVNSIDENRRTPLSHAAGNGHVKVVWLLLARQNIKVNLEDYQQQTPLSHAAEKGHDEVVWLLLTRSDVKAYSIDKNGLTPLLHAVRLGHELIINIFLARDDVRDYLKDGNTGRTLLSHASECGHEALVRMFLRRSDTEPDASDSLGMTPLWYAARNGHEAIVQQLLEKGAELETKDKDCSRTPLSCAAERGHSAVVKLLLEKGAELETKDNDDRTPLSYATESMHEAVVKLLLEKGAKLETKDTNYSWTPLSWAARKGHEAVVKLLPTKGTEPETKDTNYSRTPLSYAAEKGQEAMVKLLLEKGAELEMKDRNTGWTPLSWAAAKGHEAVVKLLLEKGAELEIKDTHYSQTPLLYAALRGHEAVVKLLVEKGAELETKDNKDRTPLSYAAEKGHEAVVKLLLEKGAELETKDNDDRTPLSYAAEGGHEAVVKLLLEEGAELENKDRNMGWTPLSRAAREGHEAVVKLLLEKGADLETRSNVGGTPLSFAVRWRHKAVVKLLEKGAEPQ